MAQAQLTFNERLQQFVDKEVNEFLNPEDKQSLLDFVFGDKPEATRQQILGDENVKSNFEMLYNEHSETVKQWLKKNAYLMFVHNYGDLPDDTELLNAQGGATHFGMRVRKYIISLLNLFLFGTNPDITIKNNWRFKDAWDANSDAVKQTILAEKPFVIGIGRPSYNRTHQLRYQMARGGALHRMRQKQFFSGGINLAPVINGVACSISSNSPTCAKHYKSQGLRQNSSGQWYVPDPRNQHWSSVFQNTTPMF